MFIINVIEPNKVANGWEYLIRLLDSAIILAGAPGEGRLDLVHSCIAAIQRKHIPLEASNTQPNPTHPYLHSPPPEPPLLAPPVPKIVSPPSFSSFPRHAQHPFVLPGFAKEWPAIGRWGSTPYLLSCAGRGRVVPIERGGDYRDEDWGVDVMPWDSFLERIGWGDDQSKPPETQPNANNGRDSERLYMAQHSLFTQFPKLRADILVPDYVYTSPKLQPLGTYCDPELRIPSVYLCAHTIQSTLVLLETTSSS
jgi:hypothetical protein